MSLSFLASELFMIAATGKKTVGNQVIAIGQCILNNCDAQLFMVLHRTTCDQA